MPRVLTDGEIVDAGEAHDPRLAVADAETQESVRPQRDDDARGFASLVCRKACARDAQQVDPGIHVLEGKVRVGDGRLDDGRMLQYPCWLFPSSWAKQASESMRGTHSQSSEPARETSAMVLVSPMRP